MFLKNFFKHPATWVFLSLLSIGIAIAVPPAAPVLVAVAAAGMCAGGIATLVSNVDLLPQRFDNFITDHPIQALLIALGIGLFITALVLTIGFFTGGAGFAFMAPVFAALAAPFAAAATTAGISLNLAALAGATLVFASLNIPNTLKRLAAWLDSFTRDGALIEDGGNERIYDWTTKGRTFTNSVIAKKGYFPTWFTGVKSNIDNGFSLDTKRLEDEAKRKDKVR